MMALRVTDYHLLDGRASAARTSGVPSLDYPDDALGSVTPPTARPCSAYDLPHGNRRVSTGSARGSSGRYGPC